MKEILNTLYVMTQGSYLRLENEALRLDVDGKVRLRVPLHHLGGVVVFGNVLVSPFALHRCAEEGRSVVFLDRRGRFKGRLEGPQSGNVLLRRAQHDASLSPEMCLNLARAFVAGKLHNTRGLLLRGARESTDEEDQRTLKSVAHKIAEDIRSLGAAPSLDVVRGIEGHSARAYFGAFSCLVRSDRQGFSMQRRSRRPPRDRINALLSFTYAVVLNACRTAAETVGLDPQVGFLHELRPGRPALALDLMEEFRSVLAERLVLTLINRRQISHRDFEDREGGAVYLNEQGRKTVIKAYEDRRQEQVKHPELNQHMPLGLVPQVQARLLARCLRGDAAEYVPFVPR